MVYDGTNKKCYIEYLFVENRSNLQSIKSVTQLILLPQYKMASCVITGCMVQ